MIRIGYMGIPFSNSERAAMKMAAKLSGDVELVPLVDSEGVVKALLSGRIELGVVAVRNMVAGPVLETERALEGKSSIAKVSELSMPIHHCIFVRRKGAEVTAIASHIQALGQTRGTVDRMFPGIERIEVADTALAAEMLSDGRLPETTAVICGMEAGNHYRLHLITAHAEDDADNWTDFALLRKE